MIEIAPARECDMVAAFLRAEISSPRYAQCILPNLAYNNLPRGPLIDRPDLENQEHNAIRRTLLQVYRGYGANSLLFMGFPMDVTWRFVEIQPREHHKLHCANDRSPKSWVEVSEGTRSIERIARRLDWMEEAGGATERETAQRVRGIQKDLIDGKPTPSLIAVERLDENLVLVEGHSRATAYVGLEWKNNIPIILGHSVRMHEWIYY
jgi:hypothetical protein